MTDEELKSLFETQRKENAAAHGETRRTLREENAEAHAETRRLFYVALEANREEIHLVAEGVAHLDQKLDRKAAELDEKIERTAAETQAMISSRTPISMVACALWRKASAC